MTIYMRLRNMDIGVNEDDWAMIVKGTPINVRQYRVMGEKIDLADLMHSKSGFIISASDPAMESVRAFMHVLGIARERVMESLYLYDFGILDKCYCWKCNGNVRDRFI